MHAIVRIALQGHTDIRSRIDDALVEDGHLTGGIVDTIVGTLFQDHSSRCYDHRPLRYVIGTKGDDIGRRAFILTYQHILVLVTHMLGSCPGGVIEFAEGIFLHLVSSHVMLLKELAEGLAERFHGGEEDTSVADGISLYIVEIAVRMRTVVVIQTVTAESPEQGDVLHLRDIGQIDTCRITLELDVEAELGLLDIRGEIVDVLHHQLPVLLRRVVAGVLQ